MISTNKKKINFAKFLFALVFLVFASSDFSDYYFLTEQYKSEKNSIANEQFSYIREALEGYQKEAIENAENTKIDVVKGLEIAYNSDMEQLKKDIDNLLITSTFPPFLQVVSTEVSKLIFRDLSGNQKDNNDGNSFSEKGVFADNSKNCASFGPIRSWENEAQMHFNKDLPFLVRDDIFQNGKINSFWIFLKVPKELKFSKSLKNLNNTDMVVLEEIYKEYHDIRMFDYIEFINVAHIYRDRDMFGTKIVNTSGHKQENKVFVINSPFILGDVLKLPSEKVKLQMIKSFDKKYEVVKKQYEEEVNPLFSKILTKVFAAFVLFLLLSSDKKKDGHAIETKK